MWMKFQKANQMCLDQNTFYLFEKILMRVSNSNRNLMQTREAISTTKDAISWIMVSFLWINRYHFLARWHKPNTYQHLFYPMSTLLQVVSVRTKKVNVCGSDTIATFNWYFGGFLFIFFLFLYSFLWLPSLMHLD